MSKIERIARIVIAIVIGEIVLVLGTTLVLEVLFKDVGWYTSGKLELLLSGLGTFLAAVLTGAIAFLIVKQANRIPIIILSVLVFLETTWLIQSDRSDQPIWFTMLTGASLILGIWVGSLLIAKLNKSSKH